MTCGGRTVGRWELRGTVRSGTGRAAEFVRRPGIRDQLARLLGATPYPGTLNLTLEGSGSLRDRWRELPRAILEPDSSHCSALFFGARLAHLPVLALIPLIPHYPPEQVELVAACHLRSTLGLSDGQRVHLVPAPFPGIRAVEAGCPKRMERDVLYLVRSPSAFRRVQEQGGLCAWAEEGMPDPLPGTLWVRIPQAEAGGGTGWRAEAWSSWRA